MLSACNESRNAGTKEAVSSKTIHLNNEKKKVESIERNLSPLKTCEHLECEISMLFGEDNSVSITFYKAAEGKRYEIVTVVSRTYLTYKQQIGNNIYFNCRNYGDDPDGGYLYLFNGTEGIIKNMYIAITDMFAIDDNERYVCYATKAETKLVRAYNREGKSFVELYKPGIGIVELETGKNWEFTFDKFFDDLFAVNILIKYDDTENRFELEFYVDSPIPLGKGFIDLDDVNFSFRLE
jgi:hypothetical protein